LGIGTTSPQARLVSAGSSATNFKALILRNGDGTTGSSASIDFEASAGTQGDESSMAGRIAGVRTGSGTSGALTFSTTNAGVLGERARIDSSGNFQVGVSVNYLSERLTVVSSGTTSNPAIFAYNPNASYTGQVVIAQTEAAPSTSWMFYQGRSSGGTTRVNIYGNGNIQNTNGSYGSLSDERLKENIVDATPKLEKLNQVRIVNFNIKDDEQKQIGVVAQELEQIFPGMIEENQEGMKGVKYSVFVPMLIKAIQEQQQMIETLQAKVAALEAR
jgi:hypothetical protein